MTAPNAAARPSRPLRICLVSSLFYPDNVGGAEIFVETLAAALVERGHEVAVICTSRAPAPPERYRGVTLYRIGYHTPFYIKDWPQKSRPERIAYVLVRLFGQRAAKAAADAARHFRPDIINTHSLSELPPAVWAHLAKLGAPLVHTVHDQSALCTQGNMFRCGRVCTRHHWKCMAFSVPARLNSRRVQAVISVGQDVLRQHVRAGFFPRAPEHRRTVIWNAVVADRVATRCSAKRPGAPVFGYLGRIEPSKGADLFLECLRGMGPGGWKAIIAGRPSGDIARYRALAEGLDVKFPGYVASEILLREIDCLVVPPISLDSFGRTVSEALMQGVPVIAAANAGVREQLEAVDWPHMFEIGDSDGLTKLLRRFLAEPGAFSVSADMQERIRARVHPDNIAGEYERVFTTLLSEARA